MLDVCLTPPRQSIGDANITVGVIADARVGTVIWHACIGYGDRRNDAARGFAGYWNRVDA